MITVALTIEQKTDVINKALELHKLFSQKESDKSYFLFSPCCQHAWYKPIFYWLHEMAACCYFGVDLGNGLDHNFLSGLTDGTPHSSSDLLYFNLLLPFTNFSKSNSFSPSSLWTEKLQVKISISVRSSWTKNPKSNSNSTKIFQDPFPF